MPGLVQPVYFLYNNGMEEVWKDIVGYEGLYQVSNLGRVKSLRRKYRTKEKILKQTDNGFGYLYVKLTKGSKSSNFRTHRLVAIAFVPNPNNFTIVDHINGDRTDSRSFNLRWVESYKENNNNPITYKRITEALTNRVCKPVQQILNGEIVAEFKSAADAGRKLNICDGPIRKCCLGTENTYKGFNWRYK